MQNRGSNMNLEKIQSKDERTLISCFVIIVRHTRPSRHTLPPHTAHCAPWRKPPPPPATRLYGCTGFLHYHTLPKRSRRTVTSFMPPKRDASSSPKRPAGATTKRRRRSRKKKTAFVPPAQPPVDLTRPAYVEIEMVPLRNEKAMPKLKKPLRGTKAYVKPSVSPEIVENFNVKCDASTCQLACCRYLLLEENAAEMREVILNTRRCFSASALSGSSVSLRMGATTSCRRRISSRSPRSCGSAPDSRGTRMAMSFRIRASCAAGRA